MKKLLILMLILIGICSSGCATIVSGTKDTVHVSMNYSIPNDLTPRDIEISVAGQRIQEGGGFIQVARKTGLLRVDARCKESKYDVVVSPDRIDSSFAPGWFIWELLLPPGLLGIIVDFSTGAYYDYPENVQLNVIARLRKE